MGHLDQAYRIFKQVVAKGDPIVKIEGSIVCEPASTVSYREATRAYSGLADAWYQIALSLQRFGFDKPATRAFDTSRTLQATIDNSCTSS